MKVTVYTSRIPFPALSYEEVTVRQDRRPVAIVLGNGPSLRGFDFRRLSRFDVFGMNAAYRYWHEIGWFPQYYSCLDLVVGSSHREAIAELIRDSDQTGIRAFLLRQPLIKELGKDGASPKVFNFDLLRPGFESWIPGPITTGSHTCAWASILGYKDIYLLGIDCNYVEIVSNAERVDGSILKIIDDAPNINYFFDSYQRKGDKYNIPNPRKDLHLQSWRNVGEKLISRSRVLNVNFKSKVDTFPFARFDDVEKGGPVQFYSPSVVLSGSALDEVTHSISIPSCETSESLPEFRSTSAQSKTTKNEECLKKVRSILGYNAEWQSTDITEQLAFLQAVKLLPEASGVLYFGFPWAALIDLLESNPTEGKHLMDILEGAKPILKKQNIIITVCQHINLLRYQSIFAEAGVTHVFWSHAVEGLDCLPEYNDIEVLPFPFAPAFLPDGLSSRTGDKKYIYSFIELKTNEPHSSRTHNFILDHMASEQRGLVIARDQWDFDKIIFDHINSEEGAWQECFNRAAPIESWRILQDSVFSLCPSGLGPNSAWLWESIGCGAIPVVFTEPHLLPGDKALWEETTVFCRERMEDFLALPDRLESIARDQALLKRKRHALRQLWMLYGTDCFIYDIQKLFLSLAQEFSDSGGKSASEISYGKLLTMAVAINSKDSFPDTELDTFILGCSSRVLSDPLGFIDRYQENAEFRMAYKVALNSCDLRYSEMMQRNLVFKGISLK